MLVVSPRHWERAFLRAQLRELGYDAVGATAVASALRVAPEAPGRGGVAVVVLDQAALEASGPHDVAARLRSRFAGAKLLLLARATAAPAGDWDLVLRRPVRVGEVVEAIVGMIGGARSE